MGTEVLLPKIPILSDLGAWIGNGIIDALLSLVWGALTGLMWILDRIQSAFFFLTGAEQLTINVNGNDVKFTLLELLFGINWEYNENGQLKSYNFDFSEPIHNVYWAMLGVFAILFVFFLICAVIKINVNRENKESLPSMRKMFYKSIVAIVIFILLPIIFCLLLSFAGTFMETLIGIFKINLLDGSEKMTISECLFKASINADVLNDFPETFVVSWYEDSVNKIGAISYEGLISVFGDGGVNFVLLLIAVCCCLVGLAMSVITVAERLINIAMLYVIAPVVIASIPLDDGKRWESWKDIAVVKVLTAAANVVSIYLFLFILQEFGNYILSGLGNEVFPIIYIIIAISGAFCCAKAGTFIANIISANAGQQEGMSWMGNQAMLRAAGALAGATLKVAGGILGISKLQDKNNTNSSSNNGGGDGGGGGSLLNSGGGQSDTAYTHDSSQLSRGYNEMQMRRNDSNDNARNGLSKPSVTEGVKQAMQTASSTPGKVLSAVGTGIKKGVGAVKTVVSNLNVPGALKLVGAVAGGAAALAIGGGRLLKNKLTQNKVNKNITGGTEAARSSVESVNNHSGEKVAGDNNNLINGSFHKTSGKPLEPGTKPTQPQEQTSNTNRTSNQETENGGSNNIYSQKPGGLKPKPNNSDEQTGETGSKKTKAPLDISIKSNGPVTVNINPTSPLSAGTKSTEKRDNKVESLKKKINTNKPEGGEGGNQ